MKLKKLLAIGMSLAISMGITACDKKANVANKPTKITPPANQEKVALDENYAEQYSKLYGDYTSGVKNYEMYLTPQGVDEYYKANDYPGNQKYLENVKLAYKNDKEQMKVFVNSLKDNTKIKDDDLKKMNDGLIAEGEKAISNIDEKIKKLDKIPTDDIAKSRAEFIKLVNNTTTFKNENKDNFTKMLENMNKKLDIKPNELNNPNNNTKNITPNPKLNNDTNNNTKDITPNPKLNNNTKNITQDPKLNNNTNNNMNNVTPNPKLNNK